ncbi:MAG: AbrB/MazE/SpoVT family DNA-binding domain-containing protein [Dehalococcoidia bacterium]|nr:AbrB/MazE/SpoVT family DNA-binding domain-containing protein [Dehalococcoidia bacterium]
MLDVTKVSVKGQVTIPVEIRRKMNLRSGDRVVFMEKSGEIFLRNSNRLAFEGFQHEMAGQAEKAGLNSEQDVVDFVNEMRNEMWEKRLEGNV